MFECLFYFGSLGLQGGLVYVCEGVEVSFMELFVIFPGASGINFSSIDATISQTAAVSFSSDFILQYSGNIFLKNHFGTKLHKNY